MLGQAKALMTTPDRRALTVKASKQSYSPILLRLKKPPQPIRSIHTPMLGQAKGLHGHT